MIAHINVTLLTIFMMLKMGLTKSRLHNRTVWNTLDHDNYDRRAHYQDRTGRPHRRRDHAVCMSLHCQAAGSYHRPSGSETVTLQPDCGVIAQCCSPAAGLRLSE